MGKKRKKRHKRWLRRNGRFTWKQHRLGTRRTLHFQSTKIPATPDQQHQVWAPGCHPKLMCQGAYELPIYVFNYIFPCWMWYIIELHINHPFNIFLDRNLWFGWHGEEFHWTATWGIHPILGCKVPSKFSRFLHIPTQYSTYTSHQIPATSL